MVHRVEPYETAIKNGLRSTILMVQLSSIKTLPVSSFICPEPRVERGKRNDRTKEVIGQKNATYGIY